MSDKFYLMNKNDKILQFQCKKEKYGEARFKVLEKYGAPLPLGEMNLGGHERLAAPPKGTKP